MKEATSAWWPKLRTSRRRDVSTFVEAEGEPGWRQIQREAGEEPETDEQLAYLRVQRMVDGLRREAGRDA